MEAILGIILCCKQLGDSEGEYSYTTESYNYCCTRAELAVYYSCYRMVYDLTADEEVGKIISKIVR